MAVLPGDVGGLEPRTEELHSLSIEVHRCSVVSAALLIYRLSDNISGLVSSMLTDQQSQTRLKYLGKSNMSNFAHTEINEPFVFANSVNAFRFQDDIMIMLGP